MWICLLLIHRKPSGIEHFIVELLFMKSYMRKCNSSRIRQNQNLRKNTTCKRFVKFMTAIAIIKRWLFYSENTWVIICYLLSFHNDCNAELDILIDVNDDKKFKDRQHPRWAEIRKRKHWPNVIISNNDQLNGTFIMPPNFRSIAEILKDS